MTAKRRRRAKTIEAVGQLAISPEVGRHLRERFPFYGYNRPGANVSEGVRENWWRHGMMGSAQAQYECVRVLSETEFYDDLKSIDVPVLVMHGEDDQICPFPPPGHAR